MRNSPLLRLFTCIAYFLSAVHAFSVTVGTPTQCDDLPVSWSGGQAPFQITLTPFAQPLLNVSVPASAFSNGKGSYSISPLPYAQGTQFLLTMSDATGFGSGGTTIILNVGAPVANKNCNTATGTPDFYFSTPLQLQQCSPYNFTTFSAAAGSAAVLPATITALIPGGEFISFYVTGSYYLWPAVNVKQGTNIAFFMIDSQGKQGGVSPLDQVLPLDNTSCLNANSPSSTTSAPSQTSSQSAPSQSSSQSSPSQTQSGSNTATVGIIAGSVVGGVALLGLLIILGVYCMRKASRQSRRRDDDQEVKQKFPSKHHTDYGSHPPFMQPGTLSYLPDSDPFSQHLRQISYTDSFAGSSSISSAGRTMHTAGGQTGSANTFTHQTLPVGLAAPIHPGTHLRLSSFASNDPHALFNQMQPSRLSSNTDSTTHYMSSGGFTVNGAPSSQPSYLSSNMDTGSSPMSSPGRRMNAGDGQAATSPSAPIIVHTDIEDVQAPPDAQEAIELPPQYTDRQVVVLQPPPGPSQKLLQS